jgi:hypothetical protein
MSLTKRDNSFSQASNLGALGASRSLRGTIGRTDRQDFLQFSLARRSRLDLSLAGLSDNVDLFLYNGGQRLIQQSRRSGKQSESIQANLDAGTYYLQIRTRSRLNRVNYGLSLRSNVLNSGGGGGNSGGGGGTPPILPTGAAPVLSVNQGLRLSGGGSAAINSNVLRALDNQQGAAQLTYTVTRRPQQGSLLRNGNLLGEGSTFTQAEIDQGIVSYQSQPRTTLLDGESARIQGDKIVLGKKVGEDTDLFFYNAATGNNLQLTNNAVDDEVLAFDGSTLVWRTRLDTVGTELFSYSIATGQVRQITNSPTAVPEFQKLVGSRILWTELATGDTRNRRLYVSNAADPNGQVEQIGSGDVSNVKFDDSIITYTKVANNSGLRELFVYNVDNKVTTSLTNPAARRGGETFVDSDQGYALWSAISTTAFPTRPDLFLTNLATNQTSVLLGGGNSLRRIVMSGPNVVWDREQPRGGSPELYFYNGTTGETVNLFANPGFSNETQRAFKGIAGSKVVWSSLAGTDTELRLYNGSETIPLTDGDDKNDTFLGMSETKVLWQTEGQIYAYDIATRSKQPLNNGPVQDLKIDGANAAWRNAAGSIFYYNSTTGKVSSLPSQNASDPGSVSLNSDQIPDLYWRFSRANNINDDFYYNGVTDQTAWLFRSTSNFPGGILARSGANAVGVNSSTRQLFYTNGTFANADSFNFTVSDGTGNTVNGTLNITVG